MGKHKWVRVSESTQQCSKCGATKRKMTVHKGGKTQEAWSEVHHQCNG